MLNFYIKHICFKLPRIFKTHEMMTWLFSKEIEFQRKKTKKKREKNQNHVHDEKK